MSQRSRILVDPQVQWSIAGRILCHWALFLVCLVSISAMVRIMASVGDQPFGESWRSAMRAQVPILGVMFIMLPVFLRDTLKMSNRFAGPMYRLRIALRALAKKEPISAINFRTGDFWQEAATDFNVVLDELQSLREENESLKGMLADQQEHVEV